MIIFQQHIMQSQIETRWRPTASVTFEGYFDLNIFPYEQHQMFVGVPLYGQITILEISTKISFQKLKFKYGQGGWLAYAYIY